ncbi:MAG: hypothetical protein ACJA2W_001332, partial [Planctomycetota bacterium]
DWGWGWDWDWDWDWGWPGADNSSRTCFADWAGIRDSACRQDGSIGLHRQW